MQRLLTLKHASSNLSKHLSNTPIPSLALSHPFTSLAKTTIDSAFLTTTHHFRSSESYHTFSGRIHGFLSNPLLSRQLLSKSSNSLFRVSTTSINGGKFGHLGARFARGFRYGPPSLGSHGRGWRSWFNQLTANDMVLGLILVNVGVFLSWRIADQNFMRDNFMISLDKFKSGRVHTLITSAFSHIDIEHIISNMIGLYFFGMNIGRTFGPEFLFKLYLAGAIGGSVFYLLHHAYLAWSSKEQGLWRRDPSRVPGLGASGAVNAILLLDIFLHPRATLYLEFIIPVPAILLGIFLIGKDLLRIVEGNSNISGSAHLGGAAVAAIAYARIRKGRV